MSKLFFDHLIEIESISVHIKTLSENFDEKMDLWDLVDEYINRKIIYLVLNELNDSDHDDFWKCF